MEIVLGLVFLSLLGECEWAGEQPAQLLGQSDARAIAFGESAQRAGSRTLQLGQPNDGRNWKRGSGLWTWQTSDVVIERSRFTNANGPGDSRRSH